MILEILDQLDEGVKKKLPEQVYVPRITTWQDLAASLVDADVLIASRLHSVVLGFVTDTPSIAISFNPKVNWVMEDFGQTNTLSISIDSRQKTSWKRWASRSEQAPSDRADSVAATRAISRF